MPTSEIMHMVNQALLAMAFGIPGVFLVLAIFYFMIKVMMVRTTRRSAAANEAKKQSEDQA